MVTMLTTHTTTFPVLSTERLTLRQLTQDDSQEVFRLLTDADVNKYYGRLRAASFEEACTYIQYINVGISKNKVFYWGICLHEESKIAGTICLWNLRKEEGIIEVGYELLPEYQRKGIMQEVLPAITGFAFDVLGYKKIEAWPSDDNQRSIHLLEKIGFRRDTEAESQIDWSKEAQFYRENEESKKIVTAIYSLYKK
ncbi:MAG TPA: GNAT family N-acetyltransferase [Flavisolibacter sp.]|nr:GNAT family N-acetyltransferase [Flavisolibacter sp.]